MLQTICATGIRVSELREITAEAVASGRAEIANKGKRRSIFLSEKLCRLLKSYLKRNGITAGPVFVTRSGRPLDRSNIWRDMKVLCKSAGVKPDKVFPHNLRHLFARTFYTQEKDFVPAGGYFGTHQCEYHPYLYCGKRPDSCPADGADGADCHIISLMW
mgnify:CR=1 FL=1